ncbi:MAG: glycosyltransferase family 4 protein [Dethiobacteria bacterium]|jgi:glycosyltransferase involved in cell wall biosynthesis
MNRKKLLYIVRPQVGGMSGHLRTLLTYFPGRWDVSLAAPSAILDPGGNAAGTTKFFQLSLQGHFSPASDFAVFRQLVRIGREENIDLFHAHGYKSALVALPAAKVCRRPVLLTVHNSLFYPQKSILPESYFNRALKQLDPLVTRYITVSGYLCRELVGRGIHAGKIVTIYNGIDTDKFRADISIEEAASGEKSQEKLAPLFSSPGPRVGTVGRLISHKGLDIFIRAAARVAPQHPTAHFFIVGKGPERAELENLRDLLGLQGRLFFLGEISQMPAFLSSLDLFVLASRSEGLSISLLEAGSLGLPMIASAVGGIPEIIQHGRTGLLFPVEDTAALAENISWLIGEPQRRQKLGLEAAKEIRARFTEEKMLKETEKIYEECAAAAEKVAL